MRCNANEKAPYRAMGKQRHDQPDPDLLPPEKIGQRAGEGKKTQVSAGLQPALKVAAARDFLKDGTVNRRSVPFDPQALAHIGQRPVIRISCLAHIRSSSIPI